MRLRTALPAAVAMGCMLGIGSVAGTSKPADPAPALPAPAVVPAPSLQPPVSWDIPIARNEAVSRFVRHLGERQRERMALYLKRSGRYEGMIRAKLRARGMPEDLFYLSMIESGFNPNARSPAHAVGLWQFVPATGRRYGLRIDGYVDERRDPEKSTDAALRYLDDLHGRFGSWYLAAAAYNAGENRVGRVMREETGAERGKEADFWRIRHRLPAETRNYVPLMVAAALVGKDPGKYGLDAVERWLPDLTETVDVPGGISLGEVAGTLGISEIELRALNPELVRGTTPPGTSYGLRVPAGTAALLPPSQGRRPDSSR
jgi:membrane-bound lytic murein transglycosylase D